MAKVCSPDGECKQVKNLGWLLRNWKLVESFSVLPAMRQWTGAYLVAHLRDGRRFETEFASKKVLACWLARPVFIGAPINWFGQQTIVDKNLCRTDAANSTQSGWSRVFG